METKSLADLMLQGFNENEIKEKVIEENIFQVTSETRKKGIASAILKRLQPLDEYLIEMIHNSDIETSKTIVLYSIMKTDRLFFEFMHEVFRDKVNYQDTGVTDRDFYTFFEAKRQQSEAIAKWAEYTFYKLQQVYTRILFEAGLIKNQKDSREVELPFINPNVIDHIKNLGDTKYIEAIIGE